MKRRRRRTPLILILALSCGLAAASPARSLREGRPLTGALEELRARGLDVIYSSDLVRPGMRVLAEPVSETSRGILDDLIAPHGLAARDGPDGRLVVVRDESLNGPRVR